MAPVGAVEVLGNTKTKTRVNSGKRWCFTLNNFEENDSYKNGAIFTVLKELCNLAIVGSEIGESGTPHLQGYFETKIKCRPIEKFKCKNIHFESAKGTRDENKVYCSKEGNVVLAFGFPEEIRVISVLRPWQQEIVDIIQEQPDDRTVRWYYETVGGIGKSALVKLLCHTYGAILCNGKSADMKYSIVKYKEEKNMFPKIVIFDVPRSSLEYVSYQGIEEIKNGCFFSTKYESSMVVMNSPHVLIFANEHPHMEKLSKDRWIITDLSIA